MVNTADTAIGWTVVGLAAAGAAYYYSLSGKGKKGKGRIQAAALEQSQRRGSEAKTEPKDMRKKKGKAKGKASDQSDQATTDVAEASSASMQTSPSERVKKCKEGKQQQQSSKLAQSSAVETDKNRDVGSNGEREEDEGMSNAEFAKQLSGLKTGTSLKKPTSTNETVRTRKQGKRNEELSPQATNGTATKLSGAVGAQDLSTASSTTGADADDDLSLPVSPEFGASETTAPSGADVSDMLEAPKRGPSVLRLTEPSNSQPSRQPKPQKVAAMPETKKQRQHRQKNEKKKALREEAEQERRAAFEKQKRVVREAEGRPAMNGVGSTKKPQSSKPSPWSKSSAISPPEIRHFDAASLLDTLEEARAEMSQDSKSVEGTAWEREWPSEEEQMRRISELGSDNAWSTVTKGGKGKKISGAMELNNGDGKASGITRPTTSKPNSKTETAANNKYAMPFNEEDWASEIDEAMAAAFPNDKPKAPPPNGAPQSKYSKGY